MTGLQHIMTGLENGLFAHPAGFAIFAALWAIKATLGYGIYRRLRTRRRKPETVNGTARLPQ